MAKEDRWEQAYNLRAAGYTYVKIGKEIGVSTERARSIVLIHAERLKQSKGWLNGLSARSASALKKNGFKSKDEVQTSFSNGDLEKTQFIGPAILNEIKCWLDL